MKGVIIVLNKISQSETKNARQDEPQEKHNESSFFGNHNIWISYHTKYASHLW